MASEELSCLERCSPVQLERQLRARRRTDQFRAEKSERRRRQMEPKMKFMCCKFVKRLTVILPVGEYSK
jgi:hypothetical protein